MEKSQYNLCVEVLRRFNKSGLLTDFILIGSWAMVFYKERFKDWPRLNKFVLMTRDMDFLIDSVKKIKQEVDIPDLLDDLGFRVTFQGNKGYIKLNHPELIVEFLTPERGRGTEKPVLLPTLGINATALRFLNFLSEGTIKVQVEDFKVTLPHPARFALHKLIVAQRRKNKDKAQKDNMMALEILNDLMEAGEKESMRSAYDAMNTQWQKRIIVGLEFLKQEAILSDLASNRKTI